MLDPMLAAFVETGEESEAERELARLLENEAVPLLRKIVAHKLGSLSDEDVDDVVGEATVLLLERLRTARSNPDSAPIARFHDYTAAVAFNACSHHLRLRHPERFRLKNRLRYVLSKDARFDTWATADGLVCGLRAWRGKLVSAASREKLYRVGGQAHQTLRTRDPGGDLPSLVANVFAIVDGPIEIDALVNVIAAASGIGKPSKDSGSDAFATLADPAPARDVSLDQRRFLERLWSEIAQLPQSQRMALLLNLRDNSGSGVLWLLPVTGVASIRSIAETLEIAPRDLAALWHRLPVDDNAIAARLGCTRQQVINSRLSARRRLRKRLGNLGDVSLSMGSGE